MVKKTKNICDVRKKHYLCGMKNIVKILYLAVGTWVAGMFDGLMNMFRLGGQTVDIYEYIDKRASINLLHGNIKSKLITKKI